ncbi:MAG: class I SAM-dependent methyltransferase, partial [Pseudomonadota bacterium]
MGRPDPRCRHPRAVAGMQQPVVTEQGRKVAAHWSRVAVTYEGVMRSLEARGIIANQAKAEDLHAVDMIHMGGLAATDALAAMARIAPGKRVLDIGSGVGGPARRFAARFGASVCGVELSERLHETAVRLTALVGLAEQVHLTHGSALALPFDDSTFDVAMIQHVAMQIAEKEQLFAEAARVLKPGGRLALHEIFAGAGVLHYPLPWATEPGMSALEPLADCIARLTRLGFEVGEFVDQSEEGSRFHAAAIATYDQALAAGEGALGLDRSATE